MERSGSLVEMRAPFEMLRRNEALVPRASLAGFDDIAISMTRRPAGSTAARWDVAIGSMDQARMPSLLFAQLRGYHGL
jgi:hypothetical protein